MVEITVFCIFVQIKEQTAKLIELKKKLGDDQGSQKFVLKTPKVINIEDDNIGHVSDLTCSVYIS